MTLIISKRYGIDDGIISTLEDIGIKWGITRERVRQLQNIWLKKLKVYLRKIIIDAAYITIDKKLEINPSVSNEIKIS